MTPTRDESGVITAAGALAVAKSGTAVARRRRGVTRGRLRTRAVFRAEGEEPARRT